MREKKKLKLKKFYLHPVTTFILLTFLVMILSGICSLFQMQATYSTLNPTTGELEKTLITNEYKIVKCSAYLTQLGNSFLKVCID